MRALHVGQCPVPRGCALPGVRASPVPAERPPRSPAAGPWACGSRGLAVGGAFVPSGNTRLLGGELGHPCEPQPVCRVPHRAEGPGLRCCTKDSVINTEISTSSRLQQRGAPRVVRDGTGQGWSLEGAGSRRVPAGTAGRHGPGVPWGRVAAFAFSAAGERGVSAVCRTVSSTL